MELSEEDIGRLEGQGHSRDDFCEVGPDDIIRLRNVGGRCFFLRDGKVCEVYEHRPSGCEIYPVNCDERGRIFVDGFCTAASTVEKGELSSKGRRLRRHLRTIDQEAEARRRR
ncbi:MAG: YkgJ family cysteine cluster protein [Methanomassiliicoccales archaeon]|jgi:hypothetical protein|nr:YkgJ family cysteine cluster protein [Methanomassiliicoccales archaeon]